MKPYTEGLGVVEGAYPGPNFDNGRRVLTWRGAGDRGCWGEAKAAWVFVGFRVQGSGFRVQGSGFRV